MKKKYNRTHRNQDKLCLNGDGKAAYCKGLCRECYCGQPHIARAILAKDLRKFGITPDQYDQMLLDQNGGCAICGAKPKQTKRYTKRRLSVDHHHGSGEIRGLLCDDCNHGVGYFKDSIDCLRLAINYLERTEINKA